MIINNNIPALNTYRQMGINQNAGSKSMEKLSSGLRINRAGDDAAGLAISEKMRAQIRGLNQASRNGQDGISMIQTTEGALQETHNILQRMRVLAAQSANDTNVEVDRNEIQKEMNQLTSEINRIGETTEFNTQKLLKGKDAEVVATDAAQTTITAGSKAEQVGEVSQLTVDKKSVVAKTSVATLQGNTSKATGEIKNFSETTPGVKGEVASVTLANGLKFVSDVAAADRDTDLDELNGFSIEIVQATTASTATAMTVTADSSNKFTITIGTDDLGNSLATNRGELYNQIKSVIDGFDFTADDASALNSKFKLEVPSGTDAAVTDVASSGTFAGGKNETAGVYEFEITTKFKEAGDQVTIAGRTFTAVYGTANHANGEFSIGTSDSVSNEAAQATELKSAINADSVLKDRFTATDAAGVITLTENDGKITGTAIDAPTVKGAGTDNKLTIKNAGGENLLTVTLAQNGSDSLNVSSNASGELTIELAHTTASKNTAAKIQEAIRNLGVHAASGVDFTKFTVESSGNWDTSEVGASLLKDTGTFVGGTQEVKGQYSFEMDKALVAGETIEIKGQIFKAVAENADAAKGEFNVADGNVNAQVAGLADAISLNQKLSNYSASTSGKKLTLTENVSTGTDLKANDVSAKATGVQGEYAVKVDNLLENGAALVIDGQEITVSNKNAHVGYENGTAIKATDDLQAQTQALVDAVNKNEELSKKYTASVGEDGSLVLQQNLYATSEVGPEVATKNSSIGNFTASFQIGANTGQSMTIEVEDMRAKALGISGDGSVSEVAAKNGKVASYVEVASVTNGTNNTNVEYALDVSSHDKASAAISVINDAIETVSAQRSQLGAFQNRLEHTISNLNNSAENLQAAESRVRDVDMAVEIMEMTRANILGQASQAMLAQANQKPQSVLQLLG